MSSFYGGNDPDIDTGGLDAAVQEAKDWAIKLDDTVDGSEFSSKYHAQASASSAADSAVSATNASNSAATAQAAADSLTSLLLNDLVDVEISNPQNGDVLTYEAASGLWKNTTP